MSIYPDWLNIPSESIQTSSVINSISLIIDDVVTLDNKSKNNDSIIKKSVSSVLTIEPKFQPEITITTNSTKKILAHDSMSGFAYPITNLNTDNSKQKSNNFSNGVTILPIIGGGRGPLINEGQEITAGTLLSMLSGLISEEHLHEALIQQLESIPRLRSNSREQSGYATHNDVITLDHDWSDYPPVIEIDLAHGPYINRTLNTVGVGEEAITYVEFPEQDILYGHSGLIGNSFTVKVAAVVKTDPTVILFDWASENIFGPPLTSISSASDTVTTSVDCMAFRVKGSLYLTNNEYAVSGTIYAQISIDGGSWVNVSQLRWKFGDQNIDTISAKFDEIIMSDQGEHTYALRGYLVTDSDDEPNRKLTGSIYIDTVSELGAGMIISNDLQLRWKSKE